MGAEERGSGAGMIVNEPSWESGHVRKDIWVHLQKPEAILTVLHIPACKVQTLPDRQEVDAPVWV